MKDKKMIITTVTTCDDNTPHTMVFTDPRELEDCLAEHYSLAWSNNGASGEKPEAWQDIRANLEAQDLLRDRDIAHIATHRFTRATNA